MKKCEGGCPDLPGLRVGRRGRRFLGPIEDLDKKYTGVGRVTHKFMRDVVKKSFVERVVDRIALPMEDSEMDERTMVAKQLLKIAGEIIKDVQDPWVTRDQVRKLCGSCADKMEARNMSRVRISKLLGADAKYADMTWEECIKDAKATGKKNPDAFCGWLRAYGPHGTVKKGPKGKVPKGYSPQKKK